MDSFKSFLRKNFYLIRAFLLVFCTIVFLYMLYFYDKEFSIDSIYNYLTDYRMYLALIFSVIGALLVGNTLFNKKNIENFTSL